MLHLLFLILKRQLDRSQSQYCQPPKQLFLWTCVAWIPSSPTTESFPGHWPQLHAPCSVWYLLPDALTLLQLSHKANSSKSELGYWHLSSIRKRTWRISLLILVKNIIKPHEIRTFEMHLYPKQQICSFLQSHNTFTLLSPFNILQNISWYATTQIQAELYPLAPQTPSAKPFRASESLEQRLCL